MKAKSILYRNFSTLNDIEKQFFNDNEYLCLCDATNVVYLSTELLWLVEDFESLSTKQLKTIENHPKQLIAVCRDYLNSIN